MSTNFEISKKILDALVSAGVQEFVVCPGSRNAPLVKLLIESQKIVVTSFFEERSASFFALGRALQTQLPVAVVTTSGTAVAETLPAVIEAHYSGRPLVVLSADRPKFFRGTGAPQSIEQSEILSKYCVKNYDFDSSENICFEISRTGPTHINVCFEEPLLTFEWEKLRLDESSLNIGDESSLHSSPFLKKNTFNKDLFRNEERESIEIALQKLKNPLVIVGGLSSLLEERVKEVLDLWDVPLYIEGTSGLREWTTEKKITAGNEFLTAIARENLFDSIIRIGSVPTLRFWRDLELLDHNVVSFSQNSFTGLGRIKEKPFFLETALETLKKIKICNQNTKTVALRNELVSIELNNLIARYENSEPSFFYTLSQQVDGALFLGNSLPIREWDLVATFQGEPRKVIANRGANGIDGQISTYLATDCEFGLFGDLTALYDLVSLGISPKVKKKQLVIINNFSGEIFSRIYKESFFQSPHSWKFENWAKMFSWDYLTCSSKGELERIGESKINSPRRVIEVFPDKKESACFWRDYKKIVMEKP